MKAWIGIMGDVTFNKGDAVEVLDNCDATLFFDKKEAKDWACSEGDLLLEVDILSVVTMQSLLKANVVYSNNKIKPTTKKKGAK